MKYKQLSVLLFSLLAISCSISTDPQQIIDQAIRKHGGPYYRYSNVEFDFRGRHYSAFRNEDTFTYMREFEDSTGFVRDILTNNAFNREVNGERVALTEKKKAGYQSSVNSVIYFALLPYPLNDPAVQKKYLGEIKINGTKYHKIEVSFSEEQGGTDFEDRFVYWIHQRHKTLDFLAYEFHRDGGGTRYRQAFNPRVVNHIRFSDYANFTSDSIQSNIEDYDLAFMAGTLKKVSDIVLENIEVSQ